MYRRFTTIAGQTIITRCTESSRIKTEKGRKPRANPTPEAVAKVNRINQERILTGIINHNYSAGDLWIGLSYPREVTIEEATKAVDKFKRQIRDWCRKNKRPYKLIECTGIGSKSGKIHHHILLNKEVPWEIIWKFWDECYTHIEILKNDGNYQRIAKYILKNAHQSKDRGGKYKKAWRASRSVIKPETRAENMKRQPTYDTEDLKPRKGYRIDRDSIRLYEHPITGACCIEYIEVSLTADPRVKRHRKGRKVPEEPIYHVDWGDQLTLDQIMERQYDET